MAVFLLLTAMHTSRAFSHTNGMNILMPYKTRTDVLRTAKAVLEAHGHSCTLYPFESAAKTEEKVRQTPFDTVLVTEGAALAGVSESIRTIYLSGEFYCPERRIPSVRICLIAHNDLSFDFITHGARDTSVRVCGIPLRESYRRVLPQAECRRALGLREDRPIFLMIGETVPVSVLKSAAKSVRDLCPQAQSILLGSSEARRKNWMSVFADDPDVFVSDTDMDLPLALCASDAVLTPALSAFVCAAARMNKIVTLLHSTVPRARKNAEFLDTHSAAFRGRTAADSVSYACRLLESDRLHANMTAAQEKTILSDAEERLIHAVEA